MSAPKRIDWARVALDDGTKDLARAVELGVCVSSVAQQRRKRCGAKARKRVDWSGVDFARRTADIARELGVHHSSVAYARARREEASNARG